MHYIVLDLEWNQAMNVRDTDPDLSFEIIEIGAVKLDDQLREVGRFDRLIRPQVYRQLHFKIREITRMQMEELFEGCSFLEAARDFFAWCGEDYRLCTWGVMDLTELQKNMDYFHVENPMPWPLLYYDIQKLYGLQFDGRNTSKSLETAVEELNLTKDVPFHRADADTYYTMRVMQQLDMDRLKGMVSVDYYRLPERREEELRLRFATYSKYVSRGFDSSERAMRDKEVLAVRCPLCGRNCKRRIPWFSTHSRGYLSGSTCLEHGWIRGKIRLRKHHDGKIFVVKTMRRASEEEIQGLYAKQEELRARRRDRRHHATHKEKSDQELIHEGKISGN